MKKLQLFPKLPALLLTGILLICIGNVSAQTDTTWHPGAAGGTMYTNNHVEIGNGLTVQGDVLADTVKATRIVSDTLKISRIMPADGSNIIAIGRHTAYYDVSSNNISWDITASPLGFSIGNSANASGLNAIAFGTSASASNTQSISLGALADANADYSTALGFNAETNGDHAIAMGDHAIANGNTSMAFGASATANGVNSMAYGNYPTSTTGDFSMAFGNGVSTVGDYSMALGNEITTTGNKAMALGNYLSTNAANAFVIGSGVSTGSPLANATTNSLVVAFNSTVPTLFVGPSSGGTTIGNVGIGTSTPNASALLDVSSIGKGVLLPRIALTGTGDVTTIASAATSLLVYNTATAGTSPNNVVPGYYYWNGTKWIAFGGSGGLNWSLTGNGGTTAGTNFIGTTDAVDWVVKTNNAERMRVLSGGNVGIGITAPTSKLYVKNATGVAGTNTVIANFDVKSTDNAGSAILRISTNAEGHLFDLEKNDGGAGPFRYGTYDDVNIVNPDVSASALGNINFVTGSSTSSPSIVMTIGGGSQKGKVGIGTTAPAYKIDVTGDARVTGIMGIGTAPQAGYALKINGDGLASGGSWISDQLFKTNIDSLHNASATIHQLKPRSYFFDTVNVYGINFSNKKQYGFIAQDVETILPELVITTTNPADMDTLGNIVHPAVTYKALNYNAFFGILTKGIQEQSNEIDSLKTNTTNQDSVNTAQSNEIDSLTQGLLAGKTKAKNQDSIITSLQNQLNQLTSLINDCCNNNGNHGNHGNNLIPSGTNNYKSISPTTLTDVELSNKSVIVLNQNVPNPFAEQTTISYFLPDNISRAQILFFEQSGKIIKTVDITEKGKGQLNVFANDLSSGVYTYSLIVDGQAMETKKMIKAK